jgi:hypothetical protein
MFHLRLVGQRAVTRAKTARAGRIMESSKPGSMPGRGGPDTPALHHLFGMGCERVTPPENFFTGALA